MNIPYSAIEPFGWTDIPTILMVRQGEDPALVAKIFAAIEKTFKDAIIRWRVFQKCRDLGLSLSHMELDEDILRLRAIFAGGKDVECNIEGNREGFFMSITFCVEGDTQRYGSFLEYPDGENANL